MTKVLVAGIMLGLCLGITGCATNVVVGHQNAWAGVWFGDVGVKGNGNNVTIQRGSNLRKISVFGDCNTINVEDGVTVVHIEFFGKNSTVTIPAGLLIRLTDWGKGNTIVRRPEVWDRMSETPYTSAPIITPMAPSGATPIPSGTPIAPPPAAPVRPNVQIVPDRNEPME